MTFQDQHKDKQHITYKAEGGGFQADALYNEGFTYQVYMRNDPAPKKYLKNSCRLSIQDSWHYLML